MAEVIKQTEEAEEKIWQDAIKFVYANSDFTKMEIRDMVRALKEGGYKITKTEE